MHRHLDEFFPVLADGAFFPSDSIKCSRELSFEKQTSPPLKYKNITTYLFFSLFDYSSVSSSDKRDENSSSKNVDIDHREISPRSIQSNPRHGLDERSRLFEH